MSAACSAAALSQHPACTSPSYTPFSLCHTLSALKMAAWLQGVCAKGWDVKMN